MTVTYLDRADWGGGPVNAGHTAPHSQFRGIVAHHTVYVSPDYDHDGYIHGDLDDVKRYMRWLQGARPDLGPEVPYSFCVFEGAHPGDCVVAEGRGFGRTGAHTTGFNSSRYGVALAGNSSTRPVTEGILDGYRWVGRRLADPAGAERTLGHRDTKSTECPGTSLYAALPQIQPPFTDPSSPPTPPPAPEPKRGKMLYLIKTRSQAAWWLTDWLTKRHIASREDAALVVFMTTAGGLPVSTAEGGGPHVLEDDKQDIVDRIPRCDEPI